MRHTIRKSELKRLVENTLNELDYSTRNFVAGARRGQLGRELDARGIRDTEQTKIDADPTLKRLQNKSNHTSDLADILNDRDGYWDEGYDDWRDDDEEEYTHGFDYGYYHESRSRRLVNQITESVIRRLCRR